MTNRVERGPCRRTVLLSATGIVGALAIGGGAGARLTDQSFIRDTLHRLVGPFRMEEAEFEAFAEAFRESAYVFGSARATPVRAAEAIGGAPLVERFAPPGVAARMERFERELLTSFVTTTDFLATRDDPDAPVHYLGAIGCANPYADLTPPRGA